VGGTTQGVEDNKEADSSGFQDATLADLRRQTTILSSAIGHNRPGRGDPGFLRSLAFRCVG